MNYGLFLLGRRDYGIEELRAKCLLHYAGDSLEAEIEGVLTRLIELQYLDDQRFVSGFVRREVGRYQGPSKIRWSLQQKKVSSSLIEQAFEDIDWYEVCLESLEARLHRLDLSDHNKIYRFLAGRGFLRDHIQYSLEAARNSQVHSEL